MHVELAQLSPEINSDYVTSGHFNFVDGFVKLSEILCVNSKAGSSPILLGTCNLSACIPIVCKCQFSLC